MICTAYRYKQDRLIEFPAALKVLEECEPIYEELPGWADDITAIQDIDDLPENARAYVKRVEELVETPVQIISVGPGRKQTIVLQDPFGMT
jgi:adenylosuccinate synthase